jgi:phosphohistidine phosphatase SixA
MDTCRRMLYSARLSTLLGVLVLLQWLVVPGLRPVQAQPALPAPAAGSAEQDRLVQALRGGGVVVLMRHSATVPGIGDPPGFRMDDCPTQRNLSDAGRAQAQRIGQWFRQHGIEPTILRASPWCRTRETAMLAFGRSEDWPALSNLLRDRSRQDEHAKEVLDSIARIGARDLHVLVSHGVTIDAFIGEYLQQGEMVVVRPGRSAATAASGGPPGAAATGKVDEGRRIQVVGRLLIP